jgi:hypothetical protein
VSGSVKALESAQRRAGADELRGAPTFFLRFCFGGDRDYKGTTSKVIKERITA